jgi:hypothetical protein
MLWFSGPDRAVRHHRDPDRCSHHNRHHLPPTAPAARPGRLATLTPSHAALGKPEPGHISSRYEMYVGR